MNRTGRNTHLHVVEDDGLEEPAGAGIQRSLRLQQELSVLLYEHMKTVWLANIDPITHDRSVGLSDREITRIKRILPWSRRIVRTHLAAPYKQYHSAQRTTIYAVFSGWLSNLMAMGDLFTTKDATMLGMQMQCSPEVASRMVKKLGDSGLVVKRQLRGDLRQAALIPTQTTSTSLIRQMIFGELVQDLESANLFNADDDHAIRHECSEEYLKLFAVARAKYQELYRGKKWYERKVIG
tara:strand:- start:219 stop:932 length:714 start_codon:yes stop_codon:yes gene_type:complete